MKSSYRLRKSADFKRVRRHGKSFAHPLMVLIKHPNESGKTRFAVAAGRSVGKAVQRNRAKRLLRTALQPVILSIKPGWDIILIARQPIANANLNEIRSAMVKLLKESELLLEPYVN